MPPNRGACKASPEANFEPFLVLVKVEIVPGNSAMFHFSPTIGTPEANPGSRPNAKYLYFSMDLQKQGSCGRKSQTRSTCCEHYPVQQLRDVAAEAVLHQEV